MKLLSSKIAIFEFILRIATNEHAHDKNSQDELDVLHEIGKRSLSGDGAHHDSTRAAEIYFESSRLGCKTLIFKLCELALGYQSGVEGVVDRDVLCATSLIESAADLDHTDSPAEFGSSTRTVYRAKRRIWIDR